MTKKIVNAMVYIAWFVIVTSFALLLYGVGETAGYKRGFEEGKAEGKIEGYKQAQDPDLIADRCTAYWFGSEREGAKTMQRYCKIQQGTGK